MFFRFFFFTDIVFVLRCTKVCDSVHRCCRNVSGFIFARQKRLVRDRSFTQGVFFSNRHSIVVRDANGCQFSSFPLTVTQPAALSVVATAPLITCGGASTSVQCFGFLAPPTAADSTNTTQTVRDRSLLLRLVAFNLTSDTHF